MRNLDIEYCKNEIELRGLEFKASTIYILPESISSEYDMLNEFAPELRNYLNYNGFNCEIVSREEHRFMAMRDSEIILPIIFGIPSAVISGLLVNWISSRFSTENNLRCEITKVSSNGEYSNIKVSGTKNDVIDVLNNLKED